MAPSCLMSICKKQSLSSIVGAPCRIHVVAALGADGYECDPEQHRHGFSYTHIINGNGKLIEVTKSTKFTEDEIVSALVPYEDKYGEVVDVTYTQREELRVSIRRKRESSNASSARRVARANGSTDPEHALQQKKWTPDNCRTFSNGHTAPCPLQFINDCPNMAPMKQIAGVPCKGCAIIDAIECVDTALGVQVFIVAKSPFIPKEDGIGFYNKGEIVSIDLRRHPFHPNRFVYDEHTFHLLANAANHKSEPGLSHVLGSMEEYQDRYQLFEKKRQAMNDENSKQSKKKQKHRALTVVKQPLASGELLRAEEAHAMAFIRRAIENRHFLGISKGGIPLSVDELVSTVLDQVDDDVLEDVEGLYAQLELAKELGVNGADRAIDAVKTCKLVADEGLGFWQELRRGPPVLDRESGMPIRRRDCGKGEPYEGRISTLNVGFGIEQISLCTEKRLHLLDEVKRYDGFLQEVPAAGRRFGMFGGSFGVQLMSFDPNGVEERLAINGERNERFVNKLKRVNSGITVLEESGFSDYLDRLEQNRLLRAARRELNSNGGNLMGRDTAEEEEDDEDRKMPAEEDEDNEQGEAKSSLKVDIRQANKSENTMVEAKRTPKPSLLTSMKAEEESDDISPAGIAKPLSSDTVATFNSSGDTPGQLKKPPEKKLTSNMLKFGLGESVPVDNPKPDGDDYELSEAEDQVPEDELEVVPVAVITGPEEQPEIAPPDVANAMAAGAGAPPPDEAAAAVAAADEPTETTKKRKGGGKLTANATNRNLTKLAKVDKKGMKSIGSFFGPR